MAIWKPPMRLLDPTRREALAALASLTLPTSAFADAPGVIIFSDLYENANGTSLQLSPKLRRLDGQAVTMKGFMAPPLKPESDFFVLTRFPMSICPFCSSEADWPSDIVVIYLAASARVLAPSQLIRVNGRLETGARMDPNTAFVSLIRIVAADWVAV